MRQCGRSNGSQPVATAAIPSHLCTVEIPLLLVTTHAQEGCHVAARFVKCCSRRENVEHGDSYYDK